MPKRILGRVYVTTVKLLWLLLNYNFRCAWFAMRSDWKDNEQRTARGRIRIKTLQQKKDQSWVLGRASGNGCNAGRLKKRDAFEQLFLGECNNLRNGGFQILLSELRSGCCWGEWGLVYFFIWYSSMTEFSSIGSNDVFKRCNEGVRLISLSYGRGKCNITK